MEDITASVQATAIACEEITGVKFDPRQIEATHAKKENVMAASAAYERDDQVIWAQWPSVSQRMFGRLCADIPGRLGYSEVAPTDQVVGQVVGLDCLEPRDYTPIHYPTTYTQEDYKFASRLRDLAFLPNP